MLHLANLTLRLYKDELGLASDSVSPVRFWMRSLPGAGWMVTIAASRAWGTRHAYALKWNLFVEWCSSHREDPQRCPIRVVLSFLQQGLERRLSPSTLKVYGAAIAANHDPVEGKSLGKHDWVVRFLRGARRLNPPRPPPPPLYPLGTCP